MNRFKVSDTPIDGLKVVERLRRTDERGFLTRLFDPEELAAAGWQGPAAQINHTLTVKSGAVRGMHFQRPPYAETKLVSCVRGRVLDVAVDLRTGSPTFLRWHAVELSEQNNLALLIPRGFAHGYQTLSADCELIYVHSAPYVADSEGALNAFDPRLAIRWPLPVTDVSDRDRGHPALRDEFKGIEV
jgi:dTDP-4-dehydrorhamnose 3,5-epimerase